MDTDYLNSILKGKDSLKELAEERIEAYNVEKSITNEYKKHANNLSKLTGMYKDVQSGIFDNLKKEFQLKKDIKNLEQEIFDATRKSHATNDDALKAELKISMEGMKQRKVELEKEFVELSKINKAAIGPWIYLFTQSINLFKSLDKAAWEFRSAVGYSRADAELLKNTVQKLSIEYMHIGIVADTVNKSIMAAGQLMGGMYNTSKQVVKTIAILNAQLGTSVEDAAKMLQTFAVLSGTTMDTQTYMVYFAQALSAAAGVNFNQIASDFKGMNDTTLSMVSHLPLIMAKTAVELRKMGTDINSSADASSKLLDFTQSIQDQMAASVLLGHSINLQKARELAYHRNIEGSTKEILRLTLANGFATKMDYFQQQAFAQATGRSVQDLFDMVQAHNEIENALHNSTPQAKAQAEQYEKLRSATQATAIALGKNLEYQFQIKGNQERLTAISNEWNQIMVQIGQVLLPVIDKILGFVVNHFGTIKTISIVIGSIWLANKILMTDWFFAGQSVIKILNLILLRSIAIRDVSKGGIFAAWISKLTRTGTIISGIKLGFNNMILLISKLGKFSGVFSEIGSGLLKLAARVLIPLVFVYNIFKGIKSILNDPVLMGTKGFFAFNGKLFLRTIGEISKALWNTVNFLGFGLPNLIIKGLSAASNAIFGSLLNPFKKFISWLDKWFLGHSPSGIGLSIVKGITSVKDMIFEALMSPFKMFMAWIEKIPFIGKMMSKLNGNSINNSVQHKVINSYIPIVKITPHDTKIVGRSNIPIKDTKTKKEKEDKYSVDDLYDILKQLNDNLVSGKVKAGNVYLDGSMVSSALAKGLDFKGSFGGNR